MMYRYYVAGLVLETVMPFPELTKTDLPPDFKVVWGKVPDELKEIKVRKVLAQANTQEVLLNLPKVGKYLITAKGVVIEAEENQEVAAAKTVLTFVLGVLSIFKNYYPLHCSGVVHEGGAYLFTGLATAGKSTIAAGLNQLGFPSVTDDLGNLVVIGDQVFVYPTFPRFRLWEESINFLKINKAQTYKYREDVNKYLSPTQGAFEAEALIPVKKIYLLKEDRKGEYAFKNLKGLKKMECLKENHLFPWLVPVFELKKQQFLLTSEVASKVPIVEYHRPKDKKQIQQMLAGLIEDFTRV